MMSTSDSSCKEGASKSKSNDGVCDVIGKLNNMNTEDKDDVAVPVCANCGKEGSDVNNICNKCKKVKYCNAACKKKHRSKHKKQCEEHIRLAAEHAAKLHDEKLFKQPPPAEDCPICFIRMPTHYTGWGYNSCCGKAICSGCLYAPIYDNQGNKVDIDKQNECPFCRVVAPKSENEMIQRLNKRVEAEDPIAIFNLGNYYDKGMYGLPQNYTKSLELWHRAAELGHADAYANIGYAYNNGDGVEKDTKKANHYYELGAMRGDSMARNNLGTMDIEAGNMERALKHYMIAVRGGLSKSLNVIKRLYSEGYVTKEDYTTALQSYQEYLIEIKSKQRDEAANADEDNRYY